MVRTLLLAAVLATPFAPAFSQTFENVFTFPGRGATPLAPLTKDANGDFLGTGVEGGAAGFGAIYKVTPGGTLTTVDSFLGPNGTFPTGALTLGPDGKYYGVSSGGGKKDFGTIYRLGTNGKIENLASFVRTNGAFPTGRVIASEGSFFGVCGSGGSADNSGRGVVFKLTSQNAIVVLARFAGANGAGPTGITKGADGSFYGVTTRGGSADKGTAFKVTTAGTFTKLVDFTGPNGEQPISPLLLATDGNFYGTASGSQSDPGTFFRLTPAGALTTVASFAVTNGAVPLGEIVEDTDGTIYGVTRFGGANNLGVVYKIRPADPVPALTKVADISTTTGTNPSTGLALGVPGTLFGTCVLGGAAATGTVFKVTTAGVIEKVVDLGNVEGERLTSGVIAGPGGVLFGASERGGVEDSGTLFQVTTEGGRTTLGQFLFDSTGSSPNGLFAASDGNLYGSTSIAGRLFSATTGGIISPLATFSGANDQPSALIEASDGIFYGTTNLGGANNGPTVFRYTEANGLQTLASLDSTSAKNPSGPLVEGPDGALYGTTSAGGAKDLGTVFRVTKSGALSIIASFAGFANGSRPVGPLVVAADGNLYGMASGGGAFGNGTVFRVSTTGKLNEVTSFTGFNGAVPQGGLISGPGGNLYGTAFLGGGLNKYGTVFKVSLKGKVTVLQVFDGSNGAYPRSTLCIGPDGNLYGTTYNTVFRLKTNNQPPVAKNDTLVLPAIAANVVKNDEDPNDDRLQVVSVTQGAFGSVEINGDGTVTYTPSPTFDETDSFTYTVTDGLGGMSTATVTVSLPPDIIRAGSGIYGGSLTVGDAFRGYWAMGVTGVGAFTGAVFVDGEKTAIKGIFGPDGTFTKSFPRKSPLPPLLVTLFLDPARNLLTGTIFDGTTTFDVQLVRTLPIFTNTSPTPRAGRYTVLLTPNATGSLLPAGTGFATMTITPKGAIAVVGKLGDNTPFSAGSFISRADSFPFYAPVYAKKKGYLAGLVEFADSETSDATGVLNWRKPAQSSDSYYPGGFETSATLQAARYTKTNPVLPFPNTTPNAELSLLDGGLEKALSISANNAATVTAPGQDKLKLKINAVSGRFMGSYVDSIGAKRPLGGAIFQKGPAPHGEGTYLSDDASGAVILTPGAP